MEKTADKAVGRTRGGLNTKLHVIVDGLGNPVEFMLSAGNDHDSVHVVELLKKVEISGSNVLADRAYGAKAIRAYISEQGASYIIPPQSNVSALDQWIGGYTKNGIWLNVSSKSSNGFAESPPDMTNWMLLFSPSFTLPLSLFC